MGIQINGNNDTISALDGSWTAEGATTFTGAAGFNGKVSIGGTLTYEDVTNIDSVGLVTAREGIFLPDSKLIKLGNTAASPHFTIEHTGSNGVVDTNTGDLILRSDADDVKILAEDDIVLRDNNDSTNFIHCINGASVKLYNAGNERLETTNQGTKISGGADTVLLVEGTSTASRIDLKTSSHHRFWQTLESDGRFRFYDQTNAGERLTITSAGNVGINSTAPSQKLDVMDGTVVVHPSGKTGVALNGITGQDVGVVRWGGDNHHAILLRGSSSADGTTITGGDTMEFREYGAYSFKTGNNSGTMAERFRIASDGQSIFKANKASGYIAEFHQEHADNPGTVFIDSPTDNNIRPSALHLAQAGTVKWVLGQVYSSTSDRAFHICSGTGQANSKLVITTAGKVGIGTNNPSQKVSIANGRVNIDVKDEYYGVWADGDTSGENHISVGRWYNTGGGLKSGYTAYGINNLILENNHATANHCLIIQPNGQKVAIGTHITTDELVHIKGNVKATDYVGDYPLSNRRINMNGDFKIAQRGTSQSSITGNGRYVWDRWYWQNHGPTVTLSQDFSTLPVGQGFRTAAKIETTSASSGHVGNVMAMVYAWEGQDLIRLKYGSANAESLTVSFWARSSQTGVFVTTLKHDSKIVSEKHTISSANTYQKYTWVIPGDTSDAIGSTGANAGMNLYVYISAGSNTTGGGHMDTWAAHHPAHMASGQTLDLLSNTGTFYITGIQVEHGEVVTPYEHIGYGDELAKCQRYYYKMPIDTNGPPAYQYHNNHKQSVVFFPTIMRATPTCVATWGQAGTFTYYYHSASHFKAYIGSAYDAGYSYYLTSLTATADI